MDTVMKPVQILSEARHIGLHLRKEQLYCPPLPVQHSTAGEAQGVSCIQLTKLPVHNLSGAQQGVPEQVMAPSLKGGSKTEKGWRVED
jgi:hypothetical protein